jgi:cystathionine beta-lyase/cystathionine gamma-synthase
MVERLEHRLGELAHERGRTYSVADSYTSMDAFWSGVAATEAGEDTGTYWDTYENGERRILERFLSNGYGSSDALLLNCGMSAVAVAVGSLALRSGDCLLTSRTNYFETSGFLQRFVESTGVVIQRIDVSTAGALDGAIVRFRPKAVLLETAVNSPKLECPIGVLEAIRKHPETSFIVDNSVQSWLTRWFSSRDHHHDLLVVESGTKYITNQVMCGVIYGGGVRMTAARDFARDTGQQLQGRALHFLQRACVERLDQRLKIHSSNAKMFAQIVNESGGGRVVAKTLDANAPQSGWSPFSHGVGSLVFVEPATDRPIDKDFLHRWRQNLTAKGFGSMPDIRAGFGWMRTAARTYEGTKLNQPDAPAYLRVSCGIEPMETTIVAAKTLAQCLDWDI